MTITLPTQQQVRMTLKSDLSLYLYAKHVIETVCPLDGQPLTFDTKSSLLSFFKALGEAGQNLLESYYDQSLQLQYSLAQN